MPDIRCNGCNKKLNFIYKVWAAQDGNNVCEDCVHARCRAVTEHQGACVCGRFARLNPPQHIGSRQFRTCRRCLGHKQIEDYVRPRVKA